jgi:spore photoproduct lyase
MFPSANLVVFVNSQAFINAAQKQLTAPQPAYLCISYDTDLLALEDIFGYCAEWIEYARHNPHITLELRTKSANIHALQQIAPPPNAILAWTLSPDEVITRYEHRTPKLTARLTSIAKAQELGWNVRLCFDPILRVDNWQKLYSDLIHTTFSAIDPGSVYDASLGVFRIPSGYLRAMQHSNPTSKLVQYPYNVRNNSASHAPEEHQEMIQAVASNLSHYLPQEKICPVPWQL